MHSKPHNNSYCVFLGPTLIGLNKNYFFHIKILNWPFFLGHTVQISYLFFSVFKGSQMHFLTLFPLDKVGSVSRLSRFFFLDNLFIGIRIHFILFQAS